MTKDFISLRYADSNGELRVVEVCNRSAVFVVFERPAAKQMFIPLGMPESFGEIRFISAAGPGSLQK